MTRPIAVVDLETDPFTVQQVPKPFLFGWYDGTEYATIWDENDLIKRATDFLDSKREPHIIYAHNGGKFDWFYFLERLSNRSNLRIINGRIVQAYIGRHEIRDSFSIMPFGLKQYQKKEIDYSKLNRGIRNNHKAEIIEYLRIDCVSLYELVVAFWNEFGDFLTVGSAGLKQLRGFHKFDSGGPGFDASFREPYYFGGRVQCFKSGIINKPVKVIDVNSMYPYVMANFSHPISPINSVSKWIEADTCFVTAEGFSHGAFAVRTKTGINFPIAYGRYNTTIHEWRAAEDTKTFKCTKLVKTYGFSRQTDFGSFVYHFYNERKRAIAAGDKIHSLFYKYILNSTYGKFAQNPANFREYLITEIENPNGDNDGPWTPTAYSLEDGMPKYILWEKPIDHQTYYNIATAASITGAARSILLRGLMTVTGPCYCDTDSIISHGTGNLQLSDTELGAWKTEAVAESAVIAGKKLYALFDGPNATGECIKKAHKGFKVTGQDIRRLALGDVIKWESEVPHFKFDGSHGFVKRTLRRTA